MVFLISSAYQLETQIADPWRTQRRFQELFFANKFLSKPLDFQIKNGWVLPLVFGTLTIFDLLEHVT